MHGSDGEEYSWALLAETRFDRDQRQDGAVQAIALPQLLGCNVIGPHLSPVEHTQDADAIRGQGIGRDVWDSGNDQFARARHSAGATALGKSIRRRAACAMCSSTATAANGLPASICVKMPSRSASANADHISLMT